jgi:hypothetical protein
MILGCYLRPRSDKALLTVRLKSLTIPIENGSLGSTAGSDINLGCFICKNITNLCGQQQAPDTTSNQLVPFTRYQIYQRLFYANCLKCPEYQMNSRR